MSPRLVRWDRWSARIQRATRQVHAAARGFGPRSVYAVAGGLSLTLGAVFTLWVLLPMPLPDSPDPRGAAFTCHQNGDQQKRPRLSGPRAQGSLPQRSTLADCGPLEYTIILLPDPASEDVFVDVVTSRPRSRRTWYTVDWPGRVRVVDEAGDAFWLKTVVVWTDYRQTHLEIEGAEGDPPTIASPFKAYSSVDRFAFVWLQGKEQESFTDRRLRIEASAATDLDSPFGKPQGKIRFQIGLRGSQLRIKDAPESSSGDVVPDAYTGAFMYHYPETDAVLMSYTELRLRTLSVYLLLLSGVLLGVGINLVTQALVETLRERRARLSRRAPLARS